MNSSQSIFAAALLGFTLLAAGVGQSQTFPGPQDLPPGEDADAPPVYVVEFLIFTYNDFNPLEEEFVPEPPHWPRSLTDVSLTSTPERLPLGSAAWYLDDVTRREEATVEPEAEAAGTTRVVARTPATATASPGVAADQNGNRLDSAPAPTDGGRWYRMLDPEELELRRAFARLNTLGAYTPLLHAGWSQATLLEDEAQGFELAWLGKLRPAGSLRLHRSRFLHLTVDVSLPDSYRFRQAPLAADARWPLAEFVRPLSYRIDVQRRVRSGELHFFDHPAFGVLVQIRPAPKPPAANSETTVGPAA